MFIVFDSIDGAGKGKQREEVIHLLLEKKEWDIKGMEFPVHDIFYEGVIHPALQEKETMNSSSWVLSYLLDKTRQTDLINKYKANRDNLLIADGYFTTTIAYQSFLMKQVPLEKLLGYADDFEIPKPDLAIFIDADPEVAFKRKEIEEGHEEGLDMFEKSISKQKELQKIYQEMASKNIFCEWEKVDGNLGINEVRDSIIDIMSRRNLIRS